MGNINDCKWKVFVRCMTYNHSAYIEDAMNGFTMQETTFPYVCMIADDASTDGEQDVIKEYVEKHFDLEDQSIVRKDETDDYIRVFAQHKTNKNCFFVVLYLKYNHYRKKAKAPYYAEWANNAKYCAMCEGDDYWISPNKLQTQVDYMDSHPECSMCFHNAFIYNMQHRTASIFSHYNEGELSVHDAISNWLVPTASMVYKMELEKRPEWVVRVYSGDYTLILKCLAAGKIWGFNKVMSVYRQNWAGTSVSALMQSHKRVHYEDHKKLLESFNRGTNFRFDEEIKCRIKYLDNEIKFYSIQESGKLWRYITVMPTFFTKVKIKVMLKIKSLLFPEDNR